MRHRLLLGLLAISLAACSPPGPPESPRSPVTETYHDVSVTDDYRWLEDWTDPLVRDWSEAQNSYAREILDGLPAPIYRQRLAALARELDVGEPQEVGYTRTRSSLSFLHRAEREQNSP